MSTKKGSARTPRRDTSHTISLRIDLTTTEQPEKLNRILDAVRREMTLQFGGEKAKVEWLDESALPPAEYREVYEDGKLVGRVPVRKKRKPRAA